MKKTVLVFGLIAGVLMSVMMLITLPFIDRIGFDRGAVVGYTGMVLSFLLIFFGSGLRRRLDHGGGGSGHGSVAFGGAILAAAMFAVVGMLEAAMTNAADDGQRQAVYTLNQFHSYDWLGWNAAFAAMLLATGLGARRNGMLPAPLAWATIVIGASLLTPIGFFGFVLLPLWLIVVGIWLAWHDSPAAPAPAAPGAVLP